MKILHARNEETDQALENTFVAIEGFDTELGRCQVTSHTYSTLLPERPHILDIDVQGAPETLDALYGAGTAYARLLAARSGLNAQIRIQCDDALRDRLNPLGYRETAAVVRLHRAHKSAPMTRRTPDKCTVVFDKLDDEYEARYFVQRYNTVFSTDAGMDYLKTLREKDRFSRIVMVSPAGLAGEMLTWVEDGVGVIGYLYTAPDFRRRGVAACLLDLSRKYFMEAGIDSSRMDVWTQLYAAYCTASHAGFRPMETLKRYVTIEIDREDW